jgi:hypothetical protein
MPSLEQEGHMRMGSRVQLRPQTINKESTRGAKERIEAASIDRNMPSLGQDRDMQMGIAVRPCPQTKIGITIVGKNEEKRQLYKTKTPDTDYPTE